jgi:hypothetical protein
LYKEELELKKISQLFVIGKPYKEMDEMEKMIEMKSLKWVWYYQIIFLFVCIIYKSVFMNKISYDLLFLIVSQALILFIFKLIYSKIMSGDGDEK